METRLAEMLWRLLGKPDGAPLPTGLNPTLMTDEQRERDSRGGVKKPETINYRTCQPEKDGLFDEEIFGKLVDDGHEGDANSYREALERSVSERPRGDEQMDPAPRCSRFGHIALAAPVVHPWLRGSSLLEELCDLKQKQIEQLLCCESVVTDGDAPQIVDSNPAEAPDALYCGAALRRWIEHRGHDTERLFLSIIGVIPPDFRPLVPLDSGSFATSDLNDLYRRVINRNNRAKRLVELNAPVVIVYNEVRMLQNAVDALFDNAHTTNPLIGPKDRQLKSLTDLLDVGNDELGSWKAIEQLDSLVAGGGSGVLEGPLPAWLFGYVRCLRALGVELAPASVAASDFPADLAPVPL